MKWILRPWCWITNHDWKELSRESWGDEHTGEWGFIRCCICRRCDLRRP